MIMTYEYAAYFKLLMSCGYVDELQQYIDNALEEQDPLSDIVLELSFVRSDDEKMLSVLNEYLYQINDSEIDYDKTVFDYVIEFLKRKYTEDSMSMENMVDLMYRLAKLTGRYLDEPWYTMYFMGDFFFEAEVGCIDKGDYMRQFDAFLNDKICYRDYTSKPNDNFFKKIIKRIFRNK